MTAGEFKKLLEDVDNSSVILIDYMGMNYNVEKVKTDRTMLGQQRVILVSEEN